MSAEICAANITILFDTIRALHTVIQILINEISLQMLTYTASEG